ncbi:MAG: hypothetical protein ACKVX7_16005 [Planctomycetota bacterium]
MRYRPQVFRGIAVLGCAGFALSFATMLFHGVEAAGDPPPKVAASIHQAIAAYLLATDKQEDVLLKKALKAVKGDLALATAALRTLPPLTQSKPGTQHGLTFPSGGQTWEYSIHLPVDYDHRERFPVLVLPDHALVDGEAGISFFRNKPGAERTILFRPIILKYAEDAARFPDQQFFAKDQAIASVMRDALVHLRRHYAVDPERLSMTGLSQAGYYTWYYAASFPDQFAAIVPEAAGGTVVRAAVLPLAANLTGLKVRILHARGDEQCPYADSVSMHDAIKTARGSVELITYELADYGGNPNPKLHPGPHALRLKNVLEWIPGHARAVSHTFTRVVRYRQQGREGRFKIAPPATVQQPITCKFSDADGVITADRPKVSYLVAPEDLLASRELKVDGKTVKLSPGKADLKLLLESFKELHDIGRLAALELRVTP